jgi:hypothetical protein
MFLNCGSEDSEGTEGGDDRGYCFRCVAPWRRCVRFFLRYENEKKAVSRHDATTQRGSEETLWGEGSMINDQGSMIGMMTVHRLRRFFLRTGMG